MSFIAAEGDLRSWTADSGYCAGLRFLRLAFYSSGAVQLYDGTGTEVATGRAHPK